MTARSRGELRDLLDRELALDVADRATDAPDESLAAVRNKVVIAVEFSEAGDVVAAAEAMQVAAHLVTDSWSYSSPVSDAVVAHAQVLRGRAAGAGR
jgi:prephenate dehydrogenase